MNELEAPQTITMTFGEIACWIYQEFHMVPTMESIWKILEKVDSKQHPPPYLFDVTVTSRWADRKVVEKGSVLLHGPCMFDSPEARKEYLRSHVKRFPRACVLLNDHPKSALRKDYVALFCCVVNATTGEFHDMTIAHSLPVVSTTVDSFNPESVFSPLWKKL